MPGFPSPMSGGRPPFDIPSGTVRLFADPDWNSRNMDLRTDGDDTNTPGVEYNIVGTPMNDNATWAAFNLPVGVVVTLHEHPVARSRGSNVANVAGCGKTMDLVGTGETRGVDFPDNGFNDTMSAWFWRYVDLDLGAVELYEHPNYGGSRTTIFLSDWQSGTIHCMGGWHMDNLCSSAKWHTVDDRVVCTLWADCGSGGRKVLAGYNKTREHSDFAHFYLDNQISYFEWIGLRPIREIIQPFEIPMVADLSNAKTFRASSTYVNETDMEQDFVVEIEHTEGETLTVSTTDSSRVGFEVGVTYSANVGLDDVLSVSESLNMSISYDYTKTQTAEKSTATSTSTVLTKTFKAAPNKTTIGTVIVRVGMVPPTIFETTARRWYDVALPGSQKDPGHHQGLWYFRDESVRGTIEGGLGAVVQSHDK